MLDTLSVFLGASKPSAGKPAKLFPPKSFEAVERVEVRRLEYGKVVRKSLSYHRLLAAVKSIAPSDNREIVDWMQPAYVSNILVNYFAESYNSAGGAMSTASGDAYIPGVVLEDGHYLSEPGASVLKRGYGYAETSEETYAVSINQRSMTEDFRWQFLIRNVLSMQWEGLLAKLKQMIGLPWKGEIPISNLDIAGKLQTFPIPVFAYARRILTPTIRIDIYYPEPSEVKVWFTDGENYWLAELPVPDKAGAYSYLVPVVRLPVTGYILVTNDGAENPVTLLGMSNRLLAR